jgi:hypothetical protein
MCRPRTPVTPWPWPLLPPRNRGGMLREAGESSPRKKGFPCDHRGGHFERFLHSSLRRAPAWPESILRSPVASMRGRPKLRLRRSSNRLPARNAAAAQKTGGAVEWAAVCGTRPTRYRRVHRYGPARVPIRRSFLLWQRLAMNCLPRVRAIQVAECPVWLSARRTRRHCNLNTSASRRELNRAWRALRALDTLIGIF